jgi:hypothetical protein
MERSRADRILADWDRVSRTASRPALPPHRPVTTALPVATITAAALILVVVVAAGLWFGLPPGVGQPGVQASPSPLEPSASPLEPSASPVKTWGPLAVRPPQDGTDMARNEGTLRITDTCVYLEDPGGDLWLLSWRANQATWSEQSRAITFENFWADGSVVTVRDGDYVVLGGSGGGAAESGESGEEWVRRGDWVAPPAPSCALDRWFGVGIVELANSDPVWGPLAVVQVTGADALIRGTLRVTECVSLAAQGEDVLLVWPAGPTTWNPEDRTLRFARTDGSVVVMRHGDEVALGGGGSTEAEDGLSGEEWASRIDWIAPPAPACLTQTRFFVSDVP